ncbi:ABC transporter permease [Spirosoma utsteinense]|uniref:ABC transport system permease protein n=1 Tax=Spirosoma utsteinense TaxID=2585773 RepID=A0ABR6W1A3_9BACT|nr:ABC transporter permease [Spirosoma utsteinense]MBC3785018.1 putative ABC transport system permease protein [Spirosoma utsteinense]MBC3790373.1 putative ABC transport system permease protein [Spirosoma utsteinense]
MNLFQISWRNLTDKPLSSFLSGLLMTFGITIISLLLLLNKQLDDQFRKNIKGIDMVVGAKGSPLQLILSSIYQIDSPVGNIPIDEAERLTRNPMIKTAIPLAMGDNYKSFRIVGTNKKYLDHFEATVGQGRLFQQDLEVVIGPRVAEGAGLKLGDTFSGSHGLDQDGEEHANTKYKVVGLLKATNTVTDQLILTPVSSVWAIHEHGHGSAAAAAGPGVEGDDHDAEVHEGEEAHEEEPREITSMLVKFRNPMGMMLARGINTNSKLQAALPNIEINRLFSLLGVGVDTLRGLAIAIMLISGISVFVSLYNSLKERRYEMALMLSMGATRAQLFGMLLLEGLVLALIGFGLGVVLSRIGLWLFSSTVSSEYHYDLSQFSILPEEWVLLGVAVLIGLLAAALPALGVYRMNISRTLAED